MVVILLLISSWFLSMYTTPAMCLWFMKVKPKEDKTNPDSAPALKADAKSTDLYSGSFYRVYRGILQLVLRFRVIVLVLAAAVLLFGGFVSTKLVREFFGPSERNQFLVYLDLPAGSRIQTTEEAVNRLTTWLSDKEKNPEITSTIAYVGTGGPRFFLVLSPFDPDPHLGFVIANTQESGQVPELIQRVRQHLADAFPGVSGRVKQMWMGSEEPGFLEIRIYGLDANYLFEKGSQLTAALKAIPGTLDVKNTWENMVPKATVVVDQIRARRAGITSEEVATSLKAHMDGAEVTEYLEGDVAIPVIFRSMERERSALSDFLNVTVYSKEGVSVPLTQIADLKLEWDYSRISRRNQERCLTVEAKHEFLKAPELLKAVEPLIAELQLKAGYRWEVGGEMESQAEIMGKLTQSLPLCVFGILILLIWQFNSFRKPIIIFMTIPLAFTGAFFGLAAMRAPFDFFAMLGLLSLAGVIINNGIVLLDKIDSERRQGAEPYNAVMTAAVSRFRPILMTTVTTVLGVMPLILSKDPLFYAMAIILGSGLIFGSVLTLGVVPVLYALLFRVKRPRNAQ